jgi:hypothetical protein
MLIPQLLPIYYSTIKSRSIEGVGFSGANVFSDYVWMGVCREVNQVLRSTEQQADVHSTTYVLFEPEGLSYLSLTALRDIVPRSLYICLLFAPSYTAT